jgi:hypothetical protein
MRWSSRSSCTLAWAVRRCLIYISINQVEMYKLSPYRDLYEQPASAVENATQRNPSCVCTACGVRCLYVCVCVCKSVSHIWWLNPPPCPRQHRELCKKEEARQKRNQKTRHRRRRYAALVLRCDNGRPRKRGRVWLLSGVRGRAGEANRKTPPSVYTGIPP